MRKTKVENLIAFYFKLGLTYAEIMCVLAISHYIVISKSTLKRTLKRLCLWRRKNFSNIVDVALFIAGELQISGKLYGYRWMHLKCTQSGLNIPRDTDYQVMKLLDAEGVSFRKRNRLKRRSYVSKGPNYVWHVDSYDKLKPYGIAINGCIDGFSRNIVWLEANTTNSNPKVIAHYYIEAVRRKKGCPQRIRSDMGNENTYIAQMQMFLRRNHHDELSGSKSFLSGKSTHNQRIEWFWGILRKEMGQFWMDMFTEMQNDVDTIFCGDFLDKSLVQFCFMKLIQEELDCLASMWNTHSLALRSYGTRGGNRPFMMQSLPELYNVEDCLCHVEDSETEMCLEETVPKPAVPCDDTVKELCNLIMTEYGYDFPTDIKEAKQLYVNLREIIKNDL